MTSPTVLRLVVAVAHNPGTWHTATNETTDEMRSA